MARKLKLFYLGSSNRVRVDDNKIVQRVLATASKELLVAIKAQTLPIEVGIEPNIYQLMVKEIARKTNGRVTMSHTKAITVVTDSGQQVILIFDISKSPDIMDMPSDTKNPVESPSE